MGASLRFGGREMKRYAIHDTTDGAAVQLFATNQTAEIASWLGAHGRGFCDLTISDRQAEQSTRIQRGWS